MKDIVAAASKAIESSGGLENALKELQQQQPQEKSNSYQNTGFINEVYFIP